MTLEQLLKCEKETDRFYQKLKSEKKLTDDTRVFLHDLMNLWTSEIKEIKKQSIY